MAVRFDRPRFHVGDLGVFIEIDVDATVLVGGLGCVKQANGDVMDKGFDLAVIVDGGLRFVEQDDRIGVLVVVRQLSRRGGAEPVGAESPAMARGVNEPKAARKKAASGRALVVRRRRGTFEEHLGIIIRFHRFEKPPQHGVIFVRENDAFLDKVALHFDGVVLRHG